LNHFMFHSQLIANLLRKSEHIRERIGKNTVKIKKDEGHGDDYIAYLLNQRGKLGASPPPRHSAQQAHIHYKSEN
jgi:hypothetical protein